MLHSAASNSLRVLGDKPVLRLLERVGRNPRTFVNLVQAGFPASQLERTRIDYARTAETPVEKCAARRMNEGHFDDEDLAQVFCRYYECDEWKLENSPLFFAKLDYERFTRSMLSPIEFEVEHLDGAAGEKKWGAIFLRYPFHLGMEKAKHIIWDEVCHKEHYWRNQSTYRGLRAQNLFQYLGARIDPSSLDIEIFFFNWEREFRIRLAAAMRKFQEALEHGVRRWQDVRNREKRRARFTPGNFSAPDDSPLVEIREAMRHLGLDFLTATLWELGRNYRRLSKTAHPDHGGSDASFRYLSACREIVEVWIRRRRLS